MAFERKTSLHPGTSCVQIADVRALLIRWSGLDLPQWRFKKVTNSSKIEDEMQKITAPRLVSPKNAIVVPNFWRPKNVVLCQRQTLPPNKTRIRWAWCNTRGGRLRCLVQNKYLGIMLAFVHSFACCCCCSSSSSCGGGCCVGGCEAMTTSHQQTIDEF